MVIDAVHPVCRARIVHEDPRDRAVDVYELTDDGSEPDVVRIVASDEQNDPCRRILAAVSGIIGDVTPSLSAVMPGLSWTTSSVSSARAVGLASSFTKNLAAIRKGNVRNGN